MKKGFRVADCDMHLQEPPDLWLRYIDPRFRSRAPVGVNAFSRDATVEFEGRRVPQQSPLSRSALKRTQEAQAADRYGFAEARGYDAESQLAAMDREGLDLAFLFPTLGLFALAVDDLDPELAAAIARGYNDWLVDFCARDPRRLVGAMMLAPHDVTAAVQEARRAHAKGLRGAFLRPNPIRGRIWHHEDYDPLWSALQELDTPVLFHEGGSGCRQNPYLSQIGEWFDKGVMGHVVSHPFGVMHALISLCMGGVFERFPKLRGGFFEANCSWLPWLLWRMDEHHEWRGPIETPELKAKPSDLFRRQGYVVIDADEEPGVHAVEAMDGRSICFSTDYPHGDAKFPHAVDTLLDLKMSDAHRRRILWDNTLELYGYEPALDEGTKGRRT